MNRDLISVIIPIYNAAAYIAQCMKYVLNQTYEDIEIILVDDGSFDNSAEICNYYAEKDSRIRYFHKPNGGPATARNVGINKARGKYIYFMDVDDIIEKNTIEQLHSMLQEKNVDFVIANAIHMNVYGEKRLIGSKQNRPFKDRKAVERLVYEFANDIKSNKILWTVWGKLYRADIIKGNRLFFNEKVHAWEDTIFVFAYLAYCNSAYYMGGQCLYICDHYKENDNGKQADSASGKMWLGPMDFRYIIREVKKTLQNDVYKRIVRNCYSEYAILSMFTSTRLIKIHSSRDLKKLYANVHRIIHDKKLQQSIDDYVQKHDDNAKIIPFLVKRQWVWLIIVVFKLQVKKIERRVG